MYLTHVLCRISFDVFTTFHTFVQKIISYLTKNGTIDKAMLYQPPFTVLNDQGLSGVFDEDAVLVKVVKIIDEINENAIVA